MKPTLVHLIEIGGVVCEVSVVSPPLAEILELILADYWRWGFEGRGEPAIRLRVDEGIPKSFPHPDAATFVDTLDYDSVAATMVFDTKNYSGIIGLSILRKEPMARVRIIELIETFLCNSYLFYFLLNGIGTMLHASAVVEDDKGYIFAGQRQAGKSTAAKLSRPRTILCDELVLLCKSGDAGRRVYGTPWFGDSVPVNQGATCKGLFFLDKGTENRVTPLSSMTGVAELVREGVIGSFLSVPAVKAIFPYARLFLLLADLLQGVPCRRLQFKKDNLFWSTIYEHEQQTAKKSKCHLA